MLSSMTEKLEEMTNDFNSAGSSLSDDDRKQKQEEMATLGLAIMVVAVMLAVGIVVIYCLKVLWQTIKIDYDPDYRADLSISKLVEQSSIYFVLLPSVLGVVYFLDTHLEWLDLHYLWDVIEFCWRILSNAWLNLVTWTKSIVGLVL